MKVAQNTSVASLHATMNGARRCATRHPSAEKRTEPVAWKLWLLRWIGLYPTLLGLYLLLGPLIGAWPVPVRVLLMSGMGTWFLSFVLMPRLTRWFSGWLHRPGPGL